MLIFIEKNRVKWRTEMIEITLTGESLYNIIQYWVWTLEENLWTKIIAAISQNDKN